MQTTDVRSVEPKDTVLRYVSYEAKDLPLKSDLKKLSLIQNDNIWKRNKPGEFQT